MLSTAASTYSIRGNVISIVDLDLGNASVTNNIESVLRKIEDYHQGSIVGFKIMYHDYEGVWDGIHWDGEHASFFALARNRRRTSSGETVSSQKMRAPWNFSDSRRTNLSLDDFLVAKEAAGVTFFIGKEPWMKGVNKLTWQTFFRVCTQEMDDLSEKAVKHVIEYCLEILEEVEAKIPRKTSLARLEAALDL